MTDEQMSSAPTKVGGGEGAWGIRRCMGLESFAMLCVQTALTHHLVGATASTCNSYI